MGRQNTHAQAPQPRVPGALCRREARGPRVSRAGPRSSSLRRALRVQVPPTVSWRHLSSIIRREGMMLSALLTTGEHLERPRDSGGIKKAAVWRLEGFSPPELERDPHPHPDLPGRVPLGTSFPAFPAALGLRVPQALVFPPKTGTGAGGSSHRHSPGVQTGPATSPRDLSRRPFRSRRGKARHSHVAAPGHRPRHPDPDHPGPRSVLLSSAARGRRPVPAQAPARAGP